MTALLNILKWIKEFALRHTFWTIGGLLVLAVAAFFIFRPSAPAQFEYITVQAATLKTSVEGSGSVSTESQVRLKSTVSGKITEVMVASGGEVKKGQALVRIDGTQAWQSLQRANLNLQKSQLALEKARAASVLKEEKTENTLEEAQTTLEDAYTLVQSTLTSTYTDVENTLSEIDTLLSGGGYLNWQDNSFEYSSQSRTYIDRAEESYWAAENAHKDAVKNNRLLDENSSRDTVEVVLDETEDVVRLTVQAAKDAHDAVAYIRERDKYEVEQADEAWDAVAALTDDINATAKAITAVQKDLTAAKQAIEESRLDLEDIESGSNDLDIRTQELDVQDKRQSVAEAQTELAKYTIIAPFAGTIGSIEALPYDWMPNNTTVATLSTDKNIAEITLNEVDVINIAIGQKAELTFDAIPDLVLAGVVSEIDSVGIETSNVVSFKVKIVLDENDGRIRPGMGVTANIITSEKENVLLVPNGSIRNENRHDYVEVRNLSTGVNDKVEVILGDSNDTDTEIISGLKEGQEVVVRQIEDAAPESGGLFAPPG
ncbi:efflux RND transporter periplasmic adaptor subunit [Acetobacteraceae bacterium]|nr:efflux RND transporter periplasmic adaptor subunit [Candidatus Parcubacteria bacterium]